MESDSFFMKIVLPVRRKLLIGDHGVNFRKFTDKGRTDNAEFAGIGNQDFFHGGFQNSPFCGNFIIMHTGDAKIPMDAGSGKGSVA